MVRRAAHLLGGLALGIACAGGAHAGGDEYAAMLGYLVDSRIDGRALSGAEGRIAVNMAAGDLNKQANLHAMAAGGAASAQASARQDTRGDRYDLPMHASATIGGNALVGASGMASINQASGSGNAEANLVTATLAQQGIRETDEAALASFGSIASAGGQDAGGPVPPGTRRVGVEASALRGFEGVLQLNQIAGSGNATDNQLSISVQTVP